MATRRMPSDSEGGGSDVPVAGSTTSPRERRARRSRFWRSTATRRRCSPAGRASSRCMKLRFASPARARRHQPDRWSSTACREDGRRAADRRARAAQGRASARMSAARALRPCSRHGAPQISDPIVRNLGTVCGSIAHADPQGDWGSALLARGAEVVARGPGGERTIPIDELLPGPVHDDARADRDRHRDRVPAPGAARGGTYLKLERKVGDFATAAVAVQLSLDNGSDRAGRHRAHRRRRRRTSAPTEAEQALAGADARRRRDSRRRRARRAGRRAAGRPSRQRRVQAQGRPRLHRARPGTAAAAAQSRERWRRRSMRRGAACADKPRSGRARARVNGNGQRTARRRAAAAARPLPARARWRSPARTSAATRRAAARAPSSLDGTPIKSCTFLAVQANGREHHDGRGPRRRTARCIRSRKGSRRARPPVRLLHAGDDARLRARCSTENPNPSEEEIRWALSGQHLPLHRLPEHRQGRPVGGRRSCRERERYDGSRDEPSRVARQERQAQGGRRASSAGKGNYVDDIKLPGMLHMAILRSPFAHARIDSIDTSRAQALPGVVAVVTGELLAQHNLAWMPTLSGDTQAVLATDKVRMQGQEVAVRRRGGPVRRARRARADRRRLRAAARRDDAAAGARGGRAGDPRRQGGPGRQPRLPLGGGRQGGDRAGVRRGATGSSRSTRTTRARIPRRSSAAAASPTSIRRRGRRRST